VVSPSDWKLVFPERVLHQWLQNVTLQWHAVFTMFWLTGFRQGGIGGGNSQSGG